MVSRSTLSSRECSLTEAPSITAPETSVTVPRMLPKVDWARAVQVFRASSMMVTTIAIRIPGDLCGGVDSEPGGICIFRNEGDTFTAVSICPASLE